MSIHLVWGLTVSSIAWAIGSFFQMITIIDNNGFPNREKEDWHPHAYRFVILVGASASLISYLASFP